MPMNPNNTKHMHRLAKAVGWSRRKLEPFRKNRVETIKQYVGSHYSDSGAGDRVPLDLIELAVGVYAYQLAARSPQGLVTTEFLELKAMAADLGAVLNSELDEMGFASTLNDWVKDAIFSMGILKLGLAGGAVVEFDEAVHDIGVQFADTVDMDDWVHDMSAKKFRQCQYMGNRYTLPLEVVKNVQAFDKSVRDDLEPAKREGANEGGDAKASTLTQDQESEEDEYQDHVDLWDLWLPQEQLFVTVQAGAVADESAGIRPLSVTEWDGPDDRGPYHLLRYTNVPGNTMPLPPVSVWRDLHEIANKLFNKIARQSGRQKSLLLVRAGAAADGSRIVQANDGEALSVDDPRNAVPADYGGPNQANLGLTAIVKDWFNWFAGNLEVMGGLSPQANTLGQEEILDTNSSRRLDAMREITVVATKSVMRDLLWWYYTDPVREYKASRTIEGTDIKIPVVVTPDQRAYDFMRFNFDVDPYSTQPKTPAIQLRKMTSVVNQFVLPMLPLLEAQGLTFDLDGFFRTVGQYADLPELTNFLIYQESDRAGFPQQVNTDRTHAPAQTTRRYERVNRPGATRQGKDAALTQLLFGGGVQDSEAAAVMRPTG